MEDHRVRDVDTIKIVKAYIDIYISSFDGKESLEVSTVHETWEQNCYGRSHGSVNVGDE